MATIKISTRSLTGTSTIRCHLCRVKCIFPNGAHVLLYDYGWRLVIIDAETAARLHDCTVMRIWTCPECGGMFNPATRKSIVWTKCPQCRCEMQQVEVAVDQQVIPT